LIARTLIDPAKLTPFLTPLQRLSASGQWLYSLEYAAEMINALGGAGTFLSLSPTLIRRFLLEQMVCIDVFGELSLSGAM
jgi:hypothetical protein